MQQKTVIIAVIFLLLSSIFAMSGDGGNEPVKEKKQVTPPEQSVASETKEQVKSNETVIDRLGVDTDMTKVELEIFKSEYKKNFVETFPDFTSNTSDWFFNNKINLNQVDEFEKCGLYLKKFSIAQGSSYKKNTLLSDVIITGKVVDLIQKDETFAPRYKFEIDQIIHGSEEIEKHLGEVEYLYFIALLGISIDNKSILHKKGIYFFQIDSEIIKHSLFLKRYYSTMLTYNDSIVCYERDFYKFDSAFKYKHGKLELSKMQKDNNYGEKYLRWYDECKIGSWDETIENIKKILEINDDKNFYNRTYKSEEK